MEQYYPAYKARDYDLLNRKITSKEYRQVLNIAREAGLTRIIT